MGRRALLLIAAILVAATGTGVVALYAKSADDRAGQQRNPVSVLVAKETIAANSKGDDIGALVESKDYPGAFVPADAVKDLKQLKGLVATTAIAPGRPLQVSLFGKPGTAATVPTTIPLDKDRVAVAVTLPDSARVAGYVVDGSYVALYVLSGGKEANSGNVVRPLLNHSVHVLKVAPYQAAGPTPGATLVTLELSLQEAPRVIYAGQKDTLYMALLPNKETNPAETVFSGDYAGTSNE